MFAPLARLFCAAALAGATVAQNIEILYPTAGTILQAGTTIDVQLKKIAPSRYDVPTELTLVAGIVSPDASTSLTVGDEATVTVFDQNSPKDSEGNQYQNISVVVANYINGPAVLNLVHVYLDGEYNVTTIDNPTQTVAIKGSTG